MSATSRSDDVVTGAASAALELASLGYPVFPCRPRRKEPATRNGLHDASTDSGLIAGWWEQWPDANVAVRTGDGLVVVDIDGDVGFESLERLEREHGNLPHTVTAATGSGGGDHIWLRAAEPVRNSAGKLAPGIDVRGDGGYVLVPPSITTGAYYWREAPGDTAIAAAPGWLLERLQEPVTRKRTPANDWVRMLDRIPEGMRNDSLARLTGLLFARGLDDDIVARLVLSVNQTACTPPLPTDEVTRIVESILRRHLRSVTA